MNTSDRRPAVGVGVVVRRKGKVLVGLRRSGAQPRTWGLPGGHIGFGETWEECARRELREETGLELLSPRFVGVTEAITPHEARHEITIFLEGEARGEPRNEAPAEHARWEWHPWDAIPAPRARSLEALRGTGYAPAPNVRPEKAPAR